MQIQAILSNPHHPEYGQATIPFPIPNEDYDRIIGMMEELEIGDAIEQDCQIDEIDSHYSILKRLEHSNVNLDELDYLAKRLDSFFVGEDAQFQGMAAKMGVSDVKDFINLTFCCQEATVVTDFSDLERIGKDHAMTINGGSMASDELEKVNGRMVALELILNHDSYVTPYGVVYDNGMKLEQLYDGRHFPCYHYQPSPITAGILSCYADRDATPRDWISLPASQKQIERAMARAGVQNTDDVLLCDFENDLPEAIENAISLEAEHIETLNDMCAAIEPLHQNELTKLVAVVRIAMPDSASQIKQLAENLDQFDFVPGVQTPEEYGRYMIRESGHFEYDDNLDGFYDYEKYGRQHIEAEHGVFTEMGYVAYQGTLSLDELMREDPAEQYQKEQDFQMGGIT